MQGVDTLVVDKTGTLTEGKPKVVAVAPAPGFDEAHALQLAASIARGELPGNASPLLVAFGFHCRHLAAQGRFIFQPS